jgi:hypothetical protein
MPGTAESPRRLSWTGAIAIALGSILLSFLLVTYDRRLVPLVLVSIFGTSAWAAIDSAKIELQKYKTRIALHPLILFNAMYILWFVLFPWYLVVRSEIRAGVLPRERTC